MPELEFVKKFVVKKILMSLKISCEFGKNECEKSLDPGTMEVHKKEYKFRTIDSSLPCGSKIIISYHGLTKHLKKTHGFDIFKLVLSSEHEVDFIFIF